MKGAIAELCASIRRKPEANRTTITGSIHHRLPVEKNHISSPAIPSRLNTFRKNRILPSAEPNPTRGLSSNPAIGGPRKNLLSLYISMFYGK
jgi:hypothetical protein